jgi:hypothetical protein
MQKSARDAAYLDIWLNTEFFATSIHFVALCCCSYRRGRTSCVPYRTYIYEPHHGFSIVQILCVIRYCLPSYHLLTFEVELQDVFRTTLIRLELDTVASLELHDYLLRDWTGSSYVTGPIKFSKNADVCIASVIILTR